MVETDVVIDCYEDFIESVKPTRKQLEERYRDSVNSWVRLTSKQSNTPKYADKLMRAVNRMERLRYEIRSSNSNR
jgi:hypothetical protein